MTGADDWSRSEAKLRTVETGRMRSFDALYIAIAIRLNAQFIKSGLRGFEIGS